jgi:hypothetical protein
MQIAQATLFCRSVAAASARLSRRAAMRMRLARVVACAQPRWRWVEAVAVRSNHPHESQSPVPYAPCSTNPAPKVCSGV